MAILWLKKSLTESLFYDHMFEIKKFNIFNGFLWESFLYLPCYSV
jgi:hypothetical protein